MSESKGWTLFLWLCAIDDVLEAVVAAALIVCIVSCVGCMIAIYRERKRNGEAAKH